MAVKKSYLAKIHIAKQQLNMSDEAYRMLLQRIAGVDSAKYLTNIEAEKLMDELKAKGFKPKKTNKTKGKPHNFKNLPHCIEKVEALLADMKLSWPYADAMAKRMFKIDKVAWLKEYEKVEAILIALSNKQEILHYSTIAEDYLIKLGTTEADKKSLLTVKGKASERIAYLKNLVERLGNQVAIRGAE